MKIHWKAVLLGGLVGGAVFMAWMALGYSSIALFQL